MTELTIETMDATELKSALDSGRDLLLLDARRPEDFDSGRLPGAVLATSDTIIDDAPRLIPDRSQTVVTYCGRLDCRRSTRSAERLINLGYNVIEFPGGLEEWVAAGYPVEGGDVTSGHGG